MSPLRNLLLVLAITSGVVSAQVRPGTIAGRVMDSSQALLQGARIEVQPTGETAASDGQGRFTIYSLAPGQYTVKVSYLGFAPFSTTVTVGAEEIARVDAVLQVA